MRKLALLAGVGSLALAATATAAQTPKVAKVILDPAQVAKGYLLITRSDGVGLKTRTLDLCGTKNYPSEQLRTARIQVNYLKKGAKVGISNEVVEYKSAGGAKQAIGEATAHANTCPHHKIDPGENNLPPLQFTITRVHDSKLLKGYLAVKIHVMGTYQGKAVNDTSFAVYQRFGDVLSGVYSFGPPGKQPASVDRTQLELCLHAAEQSAKNLRKLNGAAASNGPTA